MLLQNSDSNNMPVMALPSGEVLVVDDCEDQAMIVRFFLEDAGYKPTCAHTAKSCLNVIKSSPNLDLILLDLCMPDSDGLQLIPMIKEMNDSIPVIAMSVKFEKSVMVTALEQGASDFIHKPVFEKELMARVKNVIQSKQITAQLKKTNAQLHEAATTDPLTGASNRYQFYQLFSNELAKAKRKESPMSILSVDLDHFKNINDSFGHAAGDAALRSFVEVIRKLCRTSDIIGRLGGEEFVICCPDADAERAEMIAERVRKSMEEKVIHYQDQEFTVTVSIGVTSVKEEESDIEAILERADCLLYKAKHKGRNCFVSG